MKKKVYLWILIFFMPSLVLAKVPKDYYTLNSSLNGAGKASHSTMKKLLLSKNKSIDNDIANYIVSLYIKESDKEQINHDIAFAQMLLETNFLRYGNDAKETQNNFAGIGVTGNGVRGNYFDTILTGIRAHIQHLVAYAHKGEPKDFIVDPRFHYVKRGSAPKLKDLTQKWATDPKYSHKLLYLLNLMSN